MSVKITIEQPTQQLNTQIKEIPSATLTSEGVVTLAQVGAAPGPWVGLNYQAGWQDATSQLVAQSRLVGDTVQFRGAAMNPQNKSNPTGFAIMPVGQRPSNPRIIASAVLIGGSSCTVCAILIDDINGSQTTIPGAVILNIFPSYPATGGILLDGLFFSL